MQKFRSAAAIGSLSVMAFACQKPVETSDLSWGHLEDASLNPSAPQYLINKSASDVYKVCVAQYMAEAIPGVEEEIESAVNIWAKYLGRNIHVQTEVNAGMRRPTSTDTSDTLRTDYYKACGDDVDVVVGFAPFKGSAVGETGASWRGTSSTHITSFKRHLFLRDYTVSPDNWGTKRWASYKELRNGTPDSNAILQTLQARNTIEVAPAGTAVALQVLVHEFGHVWGLCDQYEGPSNCDPTNKSTMPDLNSIMASSSNIAKLYLTDDDIAGIRALAKRPGFNSEWPGTEDDLIAPAKPLNLGEVPYFRLKAIQKSGTQYTLNFGLVTAKRGGELHFEYRLKGATSWQSSLSYFPSDDAFQIADYSFKQTVRTEGDYEFRLSLQLRKDDGSLATPQYAQLL